MKTLMITALVVVVMLAGCSGENNKPTAMEVIPECNYNAPASFTVNLYETSGDSGDAANAFSVKHWHNIHKVDKNGWIISADCSLSKYA